MGLSQRVSRHRRPTKKRQPPPHVCKVNPNSVAMWPCHLVSVGTHWSAASPKNALHVRLSRSARAAPLVERNLEGRPMTKMQTMLPRARIPYGSWGSSYFPAWQTSALAEVNIGQFAGEAMNRILSLRGVKKSELEYLIIGKKADIKGVR